MDSLLLLRKTGCTMIFLLALSDGVSSLQMNYRPDVRYLPVADYYYSARDYSYEQDYDYLQENVHIETQSRRIANAIYEDLRKLNATCGDLASCRRNRRRTEDLRYVNCQCNPGCAKLGTCCLDSEYFTTRPDSKIEGITCRDPYGSNDTVYMMDKCSPNWDGDDHIRVLCEEHNEAFRQDAFSWVPVNSARTGIVYRNFFCYVCNGEVVGNGSPIFWKFKLHSSGMNFTNETLPDPSCIAGNGCAFERIYENGTKDYYHLYLRPELPHGLPVTLCRPELVSTCAKNWTDAATKEKCEAYTSMISIKTGDYRDEYYGGVGYRNPHCAICNWEDMSRMICMKKGGYESVWGGPYGSLFVGLFSLEDKVKRCPRNKVFDRFSEKCRAFRCGRSQKIDKGECVADPRRSRSPVDSATMESPVSTTASVKWLSL